MPSPIIARADALMQRKRPSSEFDDVPVLTDAVDPDDDFPLLTDIAPTGVPEIEARFEVPSEFIAEAPLSNVPLPDDLPPPEPAIDPALRDQLVLELTRRIEDRLQAALPQIISSTVRDFLAEQEMIANS